MKKSTLILFLLLVFSVKMFSQTKNDMESYRLTLEQVNQLSLLPLKCMEQEYPNKLSQTLSTADEMGTPKELHPAFYGCFDWHSTVHGHWMLVKLLKIFPKLDNRDLIIEKLQQHLSAENIKAELAYFSRNSEKSYERTYGWAWLLKLAEELHTWDDPIGRQLEQNLQPLTDFIAGKFIDFLPRLQYPIRTGEHINTAFGLCLAWDYAKSVGNKELLEVIGSRARDFYYNDKGCPLDWEPSGFDFLSPCLEEADLMRRVLSTEEFSKWLSSFMPQLEKSDFTLSPGKVVDASDGKLTHLYGLNYSRAWCLYGIASSQKKYKHLIPIANQHMAYSLPHIVNGEYMGEHWLATFAVYALTIE